MPQKISRCARCAIMALTLANLSQSHILQEMSSQNPKPLFYPTRRKREVLGLLAQYFVLRSKDLARLLRSPVLTGTDIRTINRTLKILDDAGLVRRLRYLNPENDGVGYACGLTDAGVRFCGEGKTFDEHSERTLEHELGISFFHLSVFSFFNIH